MASVTPWKRGKGVVTAFSQQSGLASAVKYSWVVNWDIECGGGTGSGTNTKPSRPFPDDQFIAQAAPAGSPVLVTVIGTQDPMLIIEAGEVYGVTNC